METLPTPSVSSIFGVLPYSWASTDVNWEIVGRESDPNYLDYAFSSRLAEPEMPPLPQADDVDLLDVQPYKIFVSLAGVHCRTHLRRDNEDSQSSVPSH